MTALAREPSPRGWFRRYVVPGLVFKAAVIGGAYSTGRELAEFFAPHGPWGGLLGMLAAMLVWSVTFAVSLEFARLTRSYDYRAFFRELIGPAWVVLELLMVVLLFLIIAVLQATAGEMFHALTGAPVLAGSILFTLIVSAVLLVSTHRLETLLSAWSFVLYAFYVSFLVLALASFGTLVRGQFAAAPAADLLPATADGVRYAGYNIAAIAMVLFTARNVQSRRDAMIAGALGGPLAMLPGALFFIAMMAYHPQIAAQVLPVNFLMERMGAAWLPSIYLSVILVTLVGTATTVVHSLNSRWAQAANRRGRAPSPALRFTVAAAVMLLSLLAASQFGLVQLVARGYGFIAFGFIAFFIMPVLTIGIWRIRRDRALPEARAVSP